MKSTTYKNHVSRAVRHAKRQRGALSRHEKLIGFVDQRKQQLIGDDRALAISIMAGWLRTGRLSSEHAGNLRRLRRQIKDMDP